MAFTCINSCTSLCFASPSHSRRRTNMSAFKQQFYSTRPNYKTMAMAMTTVRRSANYPPSQWSYNHLQSLTSNYVGEEYTTKLLDLKERVRKMITKDTAVEKTLCTLELVDDLQRLGISYHFKDEISGVLEKIEKKSVADQSMSMLISHALELPLLWRVQRFEAIWFIEAYKGRSDKKPLLLELAILDFNIVQGIHLEDLKWDINAAEVLPDYMKICFVGFYNTINEMAYNTLTNQELFVIPSLKKAWADYCEANLVEARWFNSGYTPKLEEYLDNSCITISIPVILLSAYLFASGEILGDALQNVVH